MIRDDPDVAARAVAVPGKYSFSDFREANILFSMMFGGVVGAHSRFTISQSTLAKFFGKDELPKEGKESFLSVFRYIRDHYNSSTSSVSGEERKFLFRILHLKAELGQPPDFAELVRRINLRDKATDPLPIDSIL